jgi:uncharacterized membrane protein YfcA
MHIVAYMAIGLAAGVMSGLLGIGGGVIVVPALVFLFHLTQQQAQGTTLAMMIPPIGLLAAWVYYRQGYVNVLMAVFLCVGFFAGGLLGAKIATGLSNEVLKKIFGTALLLLGLRMILWK